MDVDAREDDVRRASRMHLVSMRATGRRVAAARDADIVRGRVPRRYPAARSRYVVLRIADAFSHEKRIIGDFSHGFPCDYDSICINLFGTVSNRKWMLRHGQIGVGHPPAHREPAPAFSRSERLHDTLTRAETTVSRRPQRTR